MQSTSALHGLLNQMSWPAAPKPHLWAINFYCQRILIRPLSYYR